MSDSTEAILHTKALDAIGHLVSSYEAGVIGAEAFRVGVETVWTCLGGVVQSPFFNELMQDANAEVAALPRESQKQVLSDEEERTMIIERCQNLVLIRVAKAPATEYKFDLEDEAVDFVNKAVAKAMKKGFHKS